MNEQDKQLLLNDICARLPYGLFVEENREKLDQGPVIYTYDYHPYITDCKPYLRPMSSMTEIEREDLKNLCDITPYNDKDSGLRINEYGLGVFLNNNPSIDVSAVDWLNAHHFDYRGLIERGLALEAPKGTYNN